VSRPARLVKALKVREGYPFQQFGQRNDARTRNGATGCTDTVLQYLILLWNGSYVTHDEIRTVADVPGAPDRGLYPREVQRVCAHYGIPYVVRTGLSWSEILLMARRAPVGIGHSYSYWPEWQGAVYNGVKADGQPNGYAQPLRHAGRTQLTGFVPPRDRHFGVIFGRSTQGNIFGWEPNHGSTLRPESPAWEYMEEIQFRRIVGSYKKVFGMPSYTLVPTRSLPL
jgi:hypothetical protein